MAKRKRERRKQNQKHKQRMKAVFEKRKAEAAAEWFSELWELTELVRWIKSRYDSPGTAIKDYAKKHGWDLTKREWLL